MEGGRQRILFRADGNTQMGLGHIIRSSALAAMLRDTYHCVLITACDLPDILHQMQSVFHEVIPVLGNDPLDLADHASPSDLLVLDGYAFDESFQRVLAGKKIDFFCIDDIHAYPFLAKAIINHSGGLSINDYKALPDTQFYLGPRYALLRPCFLDAARSRRKNPDNRDCFLCFGGADPGNRTLSVLRDRQLMERLSFDHIHVVVGSAYRFTEELKEFARGKDHITLHRSLAPEDMVRVMQQCAFAICSPSTVVYEYMSAGGVVYLDQIADNQKDVIRYMVDEGLAFRLSDAGLIAVGSMQDSMDRQARYFDGGSGERLRKAFRLYLESRSLKIRRANENDLITCFDWANDPEVRAQSYNQSVISLEGHRAWFTGKLSDPNTFFYILERENKPVAQIRFQVANGEAVLGYLADKSIRSKGFGTSILGMGIRRFVEDYRKPVRITGFVKNSNPASQRSFERLAFAGEPSDANEDSIKYTMYYEY